jgi:hypothetical protein
MISPILACFAVPSYKVFPKGEVDRRELMTFRILYPLPPSLSMAMVDIFISMEEDWSSRQHYFLDPSPGRESSTD